MPDTIRDGKGRGHLAAVNDKNRLLTRATTVPQHLKSTWESNYFEATTGKVTLANATETPFIYLSNGRTDGAAMVIDRVFLDAWASTSGVGSGTIEYYRNPTVTGGSTVTPRCTLFSSENAPVGTFLKSLTTMTGTEWWTGQFTPSSSLAIEEGRMTVPPGYSFGISVTAPASNSSMAVSVNVAFYYISLSEVE